MCDVCRWSVLPWRVHTLCCVPRGDVHGVGGPGKLRLMRQRSVQRRQQLDGLQRVSGRKVRCVTNRLWELVVRIQWLLPWLTRMLSLPACFSYCRYSTTVGATLCTVCGTGQFSPGSSTACAACAQGQYAASTGTTACSLCPIGQYASSTGLSGCTTCSGGQYVHWCRGAWL